MPENLALMLANRRVRAYADESDELMRHDTDSMENSACGDFLAKAITALGWLEQAEVTMRESDYEGIFEFTSERQQALDGLYSVWLVPCDFAESWIASLSERGYAPENLCEFRKARERAEFALEHREWQGKANVSRVLNSMNENW